MKKALLLLGLTAVIGGVVGLVFAQTADAPPRVAMRDSTPITVNDVQTDVLVALPAQQDQPSEPDQGCIDCHTDAELLQVLAEEDDSPKPPSEGSG